MNLEYSTDGSTWTTVTMQSGTIANTFTCPANGKIYFRGENPVWCASTSTNYYNNITCSGKHNVGGNIMSLLYGSEFMDKTTFPTTNKYIFYNLFRKNYKLVNAKNLQLPATTLADWCYAYMFAECGILTTTPELPATNLANSCYESMFNYCYSLTTAPELPATNLAERCYYQMFFNCERLTTPPVLPATTLASNCYAYMFNGCSKLNYIKADFINYSSSYFTNWVSGVSSTGTFVMNPNANYYPWNITGVNGIPEGWTVVNAPQAPQ